MLRENGTRPDRASAAPNAAGRPAEKINGFALAAMSGTRLIREECAHLASINGRKHSVFRAADGHRTLIGMNETTGEVVVLESFGL